MTDLHNYPDTAEKIDRAILIIRGQKVMIDSDLAELFGVKTFRLNEQVKRNKHRFQRILCFSCQQRNNKRLSQIAITLKN